MSWVVDLLTQHAGLGFTTAIILILVLYGWKILGLASSGGSLLKTTLAVLLLLAIGQMVGVVELTVHVDAALELAGEGLEVVKGLV